MLRQGIQHLHCRSWPLCLTRQRIIAHSQGTGGIDSDARSRPQTLRKYYEPPQQRGFGTKQPKGGKDFQPAAPSKRDLFDKVLQGDQSEDTWRSIDSKVNKYPSNRHFTAIGTGGDDFQAAIVAAVEGVVGPLQPGCVQQRPSSAGAYVSVKIGPVVVQNADQVIQIFANIKAESRLKWCM